MFFHLLLPPLKDQRFSLNSRIHMPKKKSKYSTEKKKKKTVFLFCPNAHHLYLAQFAGCPFVWSTSYQFVEVDFSTYYLARPQP